MRNENKITVQTGIDKFQLTEEHDIEDFELGCEFVQKWYEYDKTVELHDNANDVLYMLIDYETKRSHYSTSLAGIQLIKSRLKTKCPISWRPINIR